MRKNKPSKVLARLREKAEIEQNKPDSDNSVLAFCGLVWGKNGLIEGNASKRPVDEV